MFQRLAGLAVLLPVSAAAEPSYLAALAPYEGGTARAAIVVPQDGPRADAVREVLSAVRLPDGFAIELFAMVPEARHMAVAADGRTIFVGTRGDKVWAVRDADADGAAEEVRTFAPNVDFTLANGVCLDGAGTLFIAELNRVLAVPDAVTQAGADMVQARLLVPQGALIPAGEESGNHGARVCKVGPDGMVYISLGQPWNVPPPDRLALYDEWGIGGIIRLNRDGTGREVFTRGIRNSVGHDFDPVTGDLWFTDNQVDGMGDDVPPGELNRQTAPGQHFGFPWYGGGHIRTYDYEGSDPPEGVIFPAVEMTAHAADLGMTFYRGTAFPGRYAGAIFSAQHGSWNRSEPVGARVMVTFVAPDGTARAEPFAEGWIADDGSYLGRPVDVAELPDGSLLVSDDYAGALYRIAWGG